MQQAKKNIEKITRVAVIATLCFMAAWGLVSVVAQIRPFWVDEWRVIYNLKFKDPAALWGPLDFMQQFPRVYLSLVKIFTAAFDYNYFSLRFPAYLAGLMTIVLGYRVANRLFPGSANRLLFVIVFISSYTFTEYFVQIKQYTMELLLSVVAVWQLLELIDMREKGSIRPSRYLLVCLSFLICPFFSYSYPIAVAPVYGIAFFQSIRAQGSRGVSLLKMWLPLVLCAISVVVFYVVDVSQLLADQGMRDWWGHLMADKGFSFADFFYNLFNLFAMVGSGLFFWILFGIIGGLAFIVGLYRSAPMLKLQRPDRQSMIRSYAVLLLLLVFALNLAKKLPVGEPRLNAFTIPSICILIISLFDWMEEKGKAVAITAMVLSLLLFAGVVGNVYTSFLSAISGPVYEKRMETYKATETAVVEAQSKGLPIFITPEVAFPYDTTRNLPYRNTVPGDWVIKTFPSFKVSANTPVCAIKDTSDIEYCKAHLPPTIKAATVGNGLRYRIVSW